MLRLEPRSGCLLHTGPWASQLCPHMLKPSQIYYDMGHALVGQCRMYHSVIPPLCGYVVAICCGPVWV